MYNLFSNSTGWMHAFSNTVLGLPGPEGDMATRVGIPKAKRRCGYLPPAVSEPQNGLVVIGTTPKKMTGTWLHHPYLAYQSQPYSHDRNGNWLGSLLYQGLPEWEI